MTNFSKKKTKEVKSPTPSRTMERRFGEANEYMIELMSRIYRNQVLDAMSAETISKFADAKEGGGNHAVRFKRLDVRVRRKLLRRFSNIRVEHMAKKFLEDSDRETQAKLYKAIEKKVGISAKQLAIKEVVGETKNALILETKQWMTKLRDETLELYTSNTLKMMNEGKGIKEIMSEFSKLEEKRKNHAKFTARNQINNFNSIMTKTRAKKIGITRARWLTSEDERVRASHAQRNGKEFDLDEGLYSSMDGKTLLPATDYQCFEGKSNISVLPFAHKMFKHWHTGKLSIIRTDDGGVFRSTANHPVLTDKGFKPAQFINVGDTIIKTTDERFNGIKINGQDIIPTFEQVFNAFNLFGVLGVPTPAVGSQFHGDMTDGKINIIAINSLLRDKINPSLIEKMRKFGFTNTEQEIIFNAFTCLGNSKLVSAACLRTLRGDMSFADLVLSFVLCHLTPFERFGFALGSWFDSTFQKPVADNIAGNTKMFGDCIFAFAVLVHGQDLIRWQFNNLKIFGGHFQSSCVDVSQSIVTKIDVQEYEGYVYNFETITGNYGSQETVVSNCRCTYELIIEGEDE